MRTVTNRTIGTNEEFATTIFARYTIDTFQDGERVFTQHNNQGRYAKVGPLVEGGCTVRFVDHDQPEFWSAGIGPVPEFDACLLAKAWVLRRVS